MKYAFISADNHLDSRWLPKNLWQDRVAAKFKSGAPKVIETDKGSVWEWEGKPRGEAADGSANERLQTKYFGAVEVTPGTLPPSDPKLILEHLDIAKIYAAVFYGDTRKWAVEDVELRKEIYRAYNDFALDLSATSPHRLIVLPNLPTAFPEHCAIELGRVIKRGAKAVELSVFDAGKPVFDPVWEPVWAQAEEAGIPICCHIGDKAGTPYPPKKYGESLAHFSTAPFAIARSIAQIVFCGAFERHSKLHISFAESRIGWLPFLINWMDRQVEEREADPSAPLSMRPSEYVKRNLSFTFEEDLIGAQMLADEGSKLRDSAMWGADYPHEQGTWPDASAAIDRIFAGVDPKIRQEVVFGRAARIFKIAAEPGPRIGCILRP